MSYLDELSAALAAVGIRGARRRRILAETEDHLSESGDESAFGEPALVAQRFADELATVGARRAAFAAFVALAPAAIAYAALFLTNAPGPDITSARTLGVGIAAAAAMLLAPQVAFACAALAVLRAWQLRSADAAPAAEIRILRRRAGLALAAGGATLAAIPVYAYEYSAGLSSTWIAAAVASSAVAALPLPAAGRSVAAAARLRPAVAGAAGDLTDDVEPLARHLPDGLVTPWRLCLLFASAVALAALAGAGLDEGARNAVAEVAAICVGFAGLGRYLGLR
jgi:hypothetical protein